VSSLDDILTLHESQLCRAEHPLVLATGIEDDVGIVLYHRHAHAPGHFSSPIHVSYLSEFVRDALIKWLEIEEWVDLGDAQSFRLSVKFGKISHLRRLNGGLSFMKYLDADHLRPVPNKTLGVPDGAALFSIEPGGRSGVGGGDLIAVRICVNQISFYQSPHNMLGLVADAFIADRSEEGLRMAQESWTVGWPLVAALCEVNAIFAHAIERADDEGHR